MYDVSFAFQVYLWFEFSNNAGAFFPLKEMLQTPLHGITAFTFFIVFLISCWSDLFIRIFFKCSTTLVSTYIFLLVDDDDLLMMIMNMLIIDPKGSWDKV